MTAFDVSNRGLRNRTWGDRDATQPQVRDQEAPSVPHVTTALEFGQAEL
jgi:hypothetical protein